MGVKSPSALLKNRRIRISIQLTFLLLIFYRGYSHIEVSPGSNPSLDAICPMGGLASIYTLVTSGSYVEKIHSSALILFVGLLASVLLVGGAFCGWMCPLGTLGDLMAKVRKKLKLSEVKIGPVWELRLSGFRWVVLALVVYFTAAGATLAFAPYDPYRTIFSLHWLFEPSLSDWPGYLIALAIIVGSLFIERMWCRFLCPLGAIIGLASKLRLVRVTRNVAACTSCGVCDKVCSMKLHISNSKSVPSTCTGCLDCVSSCPVKGALDTAIGSLPDSHSRSNSEVTTHVG